MLNAATPSNDSTSITPPPSYIAFSRREGGRVDMAREDEPVWVPLQVRARGGEHVDFTATR